MSCTTVRKLNIDVFSLLKVLLGLRRHWETSKRKDFRHDFSELRLHWGKVEGMI